MTCLAIAIVNGKTNATNNRTWSYFITIDGKNFLQVDKYPAGWEGDILAIDENGDIDPAFTTSKLFDRIGK